jgi:hypothetical protein
MLERKFIISKTRKIKIHQSKYFSKIVIYITYAVGYILQPEVFSLKHDHEASFLRLFHKNSFLFSILFEIFAKRKPRHVLLEAKKLFLLSLLTIIQCKLRYIRTSLPCNVTVVDLKEFFRFPKLLNSLLCRTRYW